MSLDLFYLNFLNPPILFFFLGAVAALIKSDLEIPHPLPKLFSLYLLFAIGYRGGYALKASGIDIDAIQVLGSAVLMSFLIPFYAYYIFRLKLNNQNAAAVAATYGSISAVTFITATSFLAKVEVEYSGYMVAAMALMESPAIVVGVLLASLHSQRKASYRWNEMFHDAFFNGSVVLLLGSLLIGFLCGERGFNKVAPFTNEIFYGMLSFFLLDMGLVSAKRIHSLKEAGVFLVLMAIIVPLINATLGILLAYVFNEPIGNALMLAVLGASGSYIAVPAAMRVALPKSDPGIYLPLSLAVTFPFNISVGIPLYYAVLKFLGF